MGIYEKREQLRQELKDTNREIIKQRVESKKLKLEKWKTNLDSWYREGDFGTNLSVYRPFNEHTGKNEDYYNWSLRLQFDEIEYGLGSDNAQKVKEAADKAAKRYGFILE